MGWVGGKLLTNCIEQGTRNRALTGAFKRASTRNKEQGIDRGI